MQCKLHKYERKEITSIQEIKQTVGWQISAFNLPETWKYSEGEGITIGILDTGCSDHPDLYGNILDGYNVINPSKPPTDKQSHGTFIAGCICALNNDLGIVGVAPKAKVVPIKVLDDNGVGDLKNVAKGIDYGIERKVDIMCLSLGCGKPLAYLRKAVKRASANNIPLFCAGGNIGKKMDSLYPARYPETIAIAALDKNYKRADFSNTAKNNIDFLAPGVDILSTVCDGWYAVFSGSSTAVPFAVGVTALILSAKKKKNLKVKLDSIDDFKNLFKNYGVDLLKFTDEKIFSGYGIIEPDKLIHWLQSEI